MIDFKVDKIFGTEENPILGEVYITISAAETLDKEGGLLPFGEQEVFKKRVAELLFSYRIDIFQDVDHEFSPETSITIDELINHMPAIGDGDLGYYIPTDFTTKIIDGVPCFTICIKLTEERGIEYIKNFRGVSLSAFGKILEVNYR